MHINGRWRRATKVRSSRLVVETAANQHQRNDSECS
jgi:hypothetical protein